MKIKPVTTSGWIDGFTFGFSGVCKGFYISDDRVIKDALFGTGRITTPKSKTYDGYEQLTLELLTDDAKDAGALRIELHVRRQGADLIFNDRCAISGNGMIMMRGALGHEACGALSFDGKANVLGEQHRRLNPIERQLPLLVEAFEYARDALGAAFPGWSPDALWLKRGEACRDLPVENAIAAARIIQHSTLYGAAQRRIDEYRRISDIEARGIPTIRYIQQAVGPEDKIYPKRDHDLRLEIACRDRDAVNFLTGVKRASFSSDGARTIFLNFLTAAAPRLNALEQHARSAIESEASIQRYAHSAQKPDRSSGWRAEGERPRVEQGGGHLQSSARRLAGDRHVQCHRRALQPRDTARPRCPLRGRRAADPSPHARDLSPQTYLCPRMRERAAVSFGDAYSTGITTL